ncbi:hypothetical protein A2U01_0047677, partial [Trifolium medium]|nr:hypothetical protein [Trifolium medium]
GGERPTKIRLGDFKPVARAWGKWVAMNIAPVGNWLEYQLENALLVKMIMESEDIDLGYLLQESIRKITSNEANVFTLGHCNLITALCRANHVPEEGDDDGELEPVKALDVNYFNRFKAGPVANNQGANVAQGVHEEEEHVEAAHADDQGLDDVMEEIDRFDSSALPNQQQQSGNWPYTH